jgi:hypothetical protein
MRQPDRIIVLVTATSREPRARGVQQYTRNIRSTTATASTFNLTSVNDSYLSASDRNNDTTTVPQATMRASEAEMARSRLK